MNINQKAKIVEIIKKSLQESVPSMPDDLAAKYSLKIFYALLEASNIE